MRRRWSALLGLLLLTGCGSLSDDRGMIVDRSDDYLDAQDQPELLIPDDLSGISIRETMVVPEIVEQVGSETYEDQAPKPNSLYVREEQQTVRIQKLGERNWLLVPQQPAMVWPKIKQFFADSGIEVASESPEGGRLDTRWIAEDADSSRGVVQLVIRDGRKSAQVSSGRDRIMLRLEQGIRARTSEVHLRHENDSVRLPGHSFPKSSDIPGIELEMLNELGAYIAANVSNEAVSFVATNISTQTKARMMRDGSGEPVLVLYLDFQRGWATVSQSLVDADVELLNKDRETASIDVVVTDSNLNQEEKSWFRSLLDGNDGALPVRVHVSQRDASSLAVTVSDEDDGVVESELSERILIMIREFAT